jgi:hypothetical protein
VLSTLHISANVARPVRPRLNAHSVLILVTVPTTLVTRAVGMCVRTEAKSFPVLPATFVNVAICMCVFSRSVCFVVVPVANVL